jgi:hypothetical protein
LSSSIEITHLYSSNSSRQHECTDKGESEPDRLDDVISVMKLRSAVEAHIRAKTQKSEYRQPPLHSLDTIRGMVAHQ